MNWQKAAIEDLKNYEARKISVQNMTEQLQALNQKADGINSVASNPVAVKGGGNVYEMALINNIDLRERVSGNLKLTKVFIERIDRALAMLSDKERIVLQYFYIHRTSTYLDDLCDKLCAEKSTVYRIKDDALFHFTLAMYGYPYT